MGGGNWSHTGVTDSLGFRSSLRVVEIWGGLEGVRFEGHVVAVLETGDSVITIGLVYLFPTLKRTCLLAAYATVRIL